MFRGRVLLRARLHASRLAPTYQTMAPIYVKDSSFMSVLGSHDTQILTPLLNIYVLIIIAVGTIKLPGNISVGIIFYRYDNCMCH